MAIMDVVESGTKAKKSYTSQKSEPLKEIIRHQV